MTVRRRWWDRLNHALFPYFGPAELGAGPRGDRDIPTATERAERPCPLCGLPMGEHRIERTADSHTSTRLRCPRG